MRNRRKSSSSTITSTVTYTYQNDYNSTTPQKPSKQIPIKTPNPPITVHFHDHDHGHDQTGVAAAKIQAAYRAHVVRTLVRKISAVKSETNKLESLIQRQETVDAVRSNEKEKLRINEALMGQLLKLDSIPGFDPGVKELRRKMSRRIVGLQEIMDGICGEKIMEMDGWDYWNWDQMVGEMEERVCRERGGEELERFCDLNLGFRCLQRFLREG